jgi:hypothetical protein
MSNYRRPSLTKIFKFYRKLNDVKTKVRTMEWDLNSLLKEFGTCDNELLSYGGKVYRLTINNYSYSGPQLHVECVGDIESMEKAISFPVK